MHLKYTRLHSALKMFYDGGRIDFTISTIGSGINTLNCSEEQKNLEFLPKNSYKTDKKQN